MADRAYHDDPRPIGEVLFGAPERAARKVRYRWRETVMSIPAGDPMTTGEKATLIWEFEQRSRRAREPGRQCGGPLTHAFLKVLRAMLRLHHSATGKASYTYETLAEEAGVGRATVGRAIPVIERLTGVKVLRRLIRQPRELRPGYWSARTANVYVFRFREMLNRLRRLRDEARALCRSSKSQSETEPLNSNFSPTPSFNARDPRDPTKRSPDSRAMEAAFARFAAAVAREEEAGRGRGGGLPLDALPKRSREALAAAAAAKRRAGPPPYDGVETRVRHVLDRLARCRTEGQAREVMKIAAAGLGDAVVEKVVAWLERYY